MKKWFFRILASLGFVMATTILVSVGYLLHSGGAIAQDFFFGYSTESCLNDVEKCTEKGTIRKGVLDPLIGFFSNQKWLDKSGKGGPVYMTIFALLGLFLLIRELWIVYGPVLEQRLDLMRIILWIGGAVLIWMYFVQIVVLAFLWNYLGIRVKVPWSKLNRTGIILLSTTYWDFLSRYMKEKSVAGILRSHWFFLKYFVCPWKIPHKGKELALFMAPFEYHEMVERLNRVIASFSGDKSYVTNFHADPDVIVFSVNENGISGSQMKANIIGNADELRRALPGYSASGSEFGEPLVETYKEDTGVRFARKTLWGVVVPDLNSLEIPKGMILLGFYIETRNGQNVEVKYFMEVGNILHSFVVGTTQHGKDVLMKNFCFSILKQIFMGGLFELHFIDVKTSDGQYLENLKSFGVYRYSERESFVKVLSKLNDQMMERQKSFGIHSNLKEYKKANPNTDMKEVFIVVNELMDLIAGSEKNEADELIRIFTSLLTKGAGAGFKLVFMAQSMRKDIDPRYGKLLANITTRFSVKIVNQEEAEIAGRGLPRDELIRLYSLIKYNAVHIEDGRIQKEFRAYNMTQEAIRDWIQKTFKVERVFENQKVNDYYLHAKKSQRLSMKEAMEEPFILSRTEWDQLVKELESRSEIERKNGLPISFKSVES